jgi:hypothetical protein
VSATVVGSSLAAAVCVARLKQLDIPAAWEHGPHVGGHFAGVSTDLGTLDVGMVLLEPHSPHYHEANEPLSALGAEWLPPRGIDVRPFLSAAHDWLAGFGHAMANVDVCTAFRGALVDDFFISDSLSIIGKLSDAERDAIASELTQPADAVHPRNKATMADVDLYAYGTAIYGATFMRLFVDPLFERLGWPKLSARHHRRLWLPLYYPETLAAVLTGQAANFGRQRFTAPSNASVGQLVADIVKVAETNDGADGRRVWLKTQKPTAGEGQLWNVALFTLPDTYKAQCITVADKGPITRVTIRQQNDVSVCAVEYHHGNHKAIPGQVADAIGVQVGDLITQRSAHLVLQQDEGPADWSPFEDQLIPASRLSFNDQLALGLWTAERLAND